MNDYPVITTPIPLIYQAQAKYGKERNFRTVYYGEWVSFPVKELGSDDAPVFARWDYMGGWSDNREIKGREIVRVFNDAFYRPYRGPASKRLVMPHLEPEALNQWNEQFNPLYDISAAGGDGDRRVALKEFLRGELKDQSPLDAREITDLTRDAEISRLEGLDGALILIDGKIWERCDEPVLALNYHTSMGNSTVDVDILFGGQSTDKVEIFRLDDRDGLLDFLRLLRNLDDPRREARINENAANIEISIPEALKAEPERQAFLRLCEKTVKQSENDVLQRGREVTNAWHDLNDILNNSKTDIRSTDIDEAFSTFKRFCEEYAKRDPLGNDHYSDRVALYASRIENRPIQSSDHRIR